MNDILPIAVTLSNNSNDTLKFTVQTYWERNCIVDNKALQHDGLEDILKNLPVTNIIPPHNSKTEAVNLYCKKGTVNYHGTFKLGFYLILARGEAIIDMINMADANKKAERQYNRDLKKRSHLIWSNAVEI